MTRAEAIDVLTQCRLLRESIDVLCARADSVLSKPSLSVIDGGIWKDTHYPPVPRKAPPPPKATESKT